MHFYKCYITVESWMTVYYEDVDYIWAHSEQDAIEEYRKTHGYRKNKKGLTVHEVEYHRVKKIKKTSSQIVTHKQLPYLGGYEYQSLDNVDHYYCGNCGKEVHNNRYCTGCDSELI